MEPAINADSETKRILEKLVINNPDLEELESIVNKFNIFEALGIIRQEIRHSDFLAFLLNPRQNHGLGDLFVKKLLQEAISRADSPGAITPIDLDLWDLDGIEIRREWQSIDLLVLDEAHKFAVILENKTYSNEHDDQLNRYKKIVRDHFPAYDQICLFLTPQGEPASAPDYISISYELICTLLERIIISRRSTLGDEIIIILGHYNEMLRRYIVGDSEIEKLCQQIYRKHQRALDLIFEFRPDQISIITDHLNDLVTQNSHMVLDRFTKAYVNFLPTDWDVSWLQKGTGWTKSGRMLMFQFTNSADSLSISLIIGPGPDEIRQELFTFCCEHEPPFKRYRAMGRLYSTIFTRTVLSKTDLQEKNIEELMAEIDRKWKDFLDHDLPKIDLILRPEIEKLKQFKTEEMESAKI